MLRVRSLCWPILSAAVWLAAATPASAQPPAGKTLLTVDDLYQFDGPRDTVLSPDGKSVAFARSWIDPKGKVERSSLWQADGRTKTGQPMEAGEPDARSPVFSPDGKWIAFYSTRSRPAGWKQTPAVPPYSDPACDVWLIAAAGGTALPLAEPDKPYGRAIHDGFYGRLAFSPDSTKLAFVADEGIDPRTPAEKTNNVAILREDQGERYTGYGAMQVWVAHLDAKPEKFAAAKIERLTPGDTWYGDPNWSPDGKAIAVHANRTSDRESVRYSINKNYDIWLIDVASRKMQQVTTGPGPDVSPRFSPDGKSLVCLSVPLKGPHRALFNFTVIDLGNGEPKARTLFNHHGPKADKPPHPAPAFPLPVDCWDGNNRIVYGVEDGLTSRTAAVEPATGNAAAFRTADLKPDESPTSRAARATRRSQLTPPGNLFLKNRLIAPQKVVRWKSTEGFEIEGALTLPPNGVAKAPYRLIVYPHGGPHSRSTLGFDFTAQIFAANGYAVFQPNFRGSSGYGQAFIDADRNDFGGGDMRDILSGVDHLIAERIADKDRLFLYGTSYGGYLTTWIIGQTKRFRAAVPVNAVTDLNMMWGLSDIQSWTEWEFGGRPWKVPEKMRKHSPITYVGQVKTPTLILHSRNDRRVPFPLGLAYYRALTSCGVPCELVAYPNEGHGISQPRHREDVLRRTMDWFARYDRK